MSSVHTFSYCLFTILLKSWGKYTNNCRIFVIFAPNFVINYDGKEIMIRLERLKTWFLIAVLTISGTVSFASCSSNKDNATEQSNISVIADKVWAFSQTHPDGFTIDIRTMTEPTEGIAVSYAATQNSHSRDQLDMVVSHALQHDGYVGGWLNDKFHK